jgi:drug/metabolite transporter (DMT)-like permease
MTATADTSPAAATRQQSHAGAIAALLGAAFVMAISAIFVRFANEAGIGPFASAFYRVGLALPALWLWARLEERAAGQGPRPGFTKPAVISGLLFAGDILLWHSAIMRTTIANATFFATSAPVFVVLYVWLLRSQRPSRSTVAGIGLCLLGGLALVGNSMSVDPGRIAGDLLGLATAVFFGFYFIAVKDSRNFAGAARVTFSMSVVAAAILLVTALMSGQNMIPQNLMAVGALLGMSWISHIGGQGLLAVALGRLPAVFSSLVIFIEAVMAAVFAWLVVGESLTLIQCLGGALILAGIWTARPSPTPVSEAHR